MDDSEDLVLKKCLKFCIDQNKTIYSINEFMSYVNADYNVIYDTLSRARILFDVEKTNKTNPIIQISIKVSLEKIYLKFETKSS